MADESSRGGRWRAPCCVASLASPSFAQPSAPLSVPPPGPAALEQIPILKDAGLEQRLDSAGAARHALRGRERPPRDARGLLRQEAGRARARVLRVPDALHAGAQRPRRIARSAHVQRRPGVRRRRASASTRAKRRRWPPRSAPPISSGTAGRAPRAVCTSSRAGKRTSGASPMRSAFTTSTTRRSISTRTPRRSPCSRLRARCRATCSVSSSRPSICGWRSSKPRITASAAPSIRCCSSATTTIRRAESTVSRSPTSSGWAVF